MSFFSQRSWFDQKPNSDIPMDLFGVEPEGNFESQTLQDVFTTQKEQTANNDDPPEVATFSSPLRTSQQIDERSQSQFAVFSQSQLKPQESFCSYESPSYSPQSNFAQNNFSASIIEDLSEEMNIASDEEAEALPQSYEANSSQGILKTQLSSVHSQLKHTQSNHSVVDDGLNATVPQSIIQIRDEVKENYSDWTFMSIIAGQCCRNFLPSTSYINLKLSLLLSIASINDKSSPIPIVALGEETGHVNKIMNSVGKLAGRFVSSSIAKFDGVSETKNGTIEGGPLLMASGGVLRLGQWEFLSPKTTIDLLRVIETGKIQPSIDMKCAIWTFWSNSWNLKKDFKNINQFLNVFGIPIMSDDPQSEDEIIEHLLNGEQADDEPLISDDDMQLYLKYISKQQVFIEAEADELLNRYYAATRKLRENAISPRAFDVLKQMTESHAKLCLRSSAGVSDALAAINISEKYIRALFDRDAFSSPADPKTTCLEDIDAYQSQLYKWCCEFTENVLTK